MQVGTLPVQMIFERDILYRVPLFQRPYVWERERQWEPFWEDIQRLAETLLQGAAPRAHFLGATVQEKPSVPPGHIEVRELIDGQQRLTTLQLFLKAFEDLATARGAENYRQAIRKMTGNQHPLSTVAHEAFKVWPTNVDRGDYRSTMEAGSVGALRRAYGKGANAAIGRQIPDAYLYFSEVVDEWLGEGEASLPQVGQKIAALYGAVRDNVRMVVIDLDDRDDAQIIFETLNARGTPLLAADLVKNVLLQEGQTQGANVEDLYERYWKEFDEDAEYWRREIGRGHAKRPRIEFYLQFFLTTQTRNDVRASHLYADYLDHARSGAAISLEARLAALHRYGQIYRRIDERQAPPRAKLALSRLSVMDVGTAYPFLLELFSRIETDPGRLTSVLADVESFLIRRMVCRLSTRGYNTLFVDMLGALEGDDEGIPERVRMFLTKGSRDVDRWPDDAEFRREWRGAALYNAITRPRLRMLLEALERAMRGPLSETYDVPAYLTVEHVMPQAWEPHWPLPDGEHGQKLRLERSQLIHTIGNLTLLNERLNPHVSNGPWLGEGGKRAGLEVHSVLHLNKRLCEHTGWDDATIAARSEALFALARDIWPRPASSSMGAAPPMGDSATEDGDAC